MRKTATKQLGSYCLRHRTPILPASSVSVPPSLSLCLFLSLSVSLSLSLSLCVSVFHHVTRARCRPTTQVPLSIFYTEIPSPQASWRLQGKINKKLISPSSPQHPRKHNSNFQKYESAYSEGRTWHDLQHRWSFPHSKCLHWLPLFVSKSLVSTSYHQGDLSPQM